MHVVVVVAAGVGLPDALEAQPVVGEREEPSAAGLGGGAFTGDAGMRS
jgi:hypothetical protein